MIYVIEVPHQLPARVETYFDRTEYEESMRTFAQNKATLEEDGTVSDNGNLFETIEDWLAHDLYDRTVLEDEQEAREHVMWAKRTHPHQWIRQVTALEELLLNGKEAPHADTDA